MTKQISSLRQRALDDMAFRNISLSTQQCYTYTVAGYARYHHTSPDKLGIEHVRKYRLHLLSPRPQGTFKFSHPTVPTPIELASTVDRRAARGFVQQSFCNAAR